MIDHEFATPVESSSTGHPVADARAAVALTNTLLSRVADNTLVSASVWDSVADTMLLTARQSPDLDTRDRLVMLAERSRTYARRQLTIAGQLQERCDRRERS